MRILASSTVWLRRIVDIALIVLVVTVLAGLTLGKLVPLTGRQTIVIGGGSMSPAIPLGSAVVIAAVAPTELTAGDVVSLRIADQNATFTHRIVTVVDRADGVWIRTQGDANPEPDPTLVPASAVIGRVQLALPLMGYLIILLGQPIGVLFVIGLAATLLAIAWLLESLEPAPIAARRSALVTAAAGGATSVAGSAPVPAWFVAGEPIASRGRTLVATGPTAATLVATGPTAAFPGGLPLLMPVIGPMSLRLVASRTRTPLGTDPSGGPRPGVREALARSREVRSRQWRYRDGGRRAGC
jgi:signal peptidase